MPCRCAPLAWVPGHSIGQFGTRQEWDHASTASSGPGESLEQAELMNERDRSRGGRRRRVVFAIAGGRSQAPEADNVSVRIDHVREHREVGCEVLLFLPHRSRVVNDKDKVDLVACIESLDS